MKTGWAGLMLAAALGWASMAQAAVIYDNGNPSDSGNEATQWVQAEDFTFDTDQSVRGAGIYVGGFNGMNDWDGTLDYWIFSDDGGLPGSILVSGAGQNMALSDTGLPWVEHTVFLLEFDFEADFAALADTVYWLAIHLSANYDRDEIYWVTTPPNGTAAGRENSQGTFVSWNSLGFEHAFYLTDGRDPQDPVATPAPAGLAFLGLGLLALGAARRRLTSSGD